MRLFLLCAALVGCAGSSDDDDPSIDDEPPGFELDSCDVTGGNLGEGSCSFSWLCPEEYWVSCAPVDGHEACDCYNGDTLVHSFGLEGVGDYCSTSADADFDARTVDLCGFPDGLKPTVDSFSMSCTASELKLNAGYTGEADDASMWLLYTGGGIADFEQMSGHGLDVVSDGSRFAPHTAVSGTIRINPDAELGETHHPCELFEQNDITYILRMKKGEEKSCILWGDDPEGVRSSEAVTDSFRDGMKDYILVDCAVVEF
ncbi:MAG: hypothetical protein ACI9MC_001747 [Kiritimatiellia bacterium]|jgi:hypothetical protein